MASNEYHVASYVVSTRPEDMAAVAEHINAIAGLEVHASDKGKLVVTAEAGSVRKLADLADDLAAMTSVMTVATVYHEYSGAGDDAT